MDLGLGLLALAPDVFWRMTPRELDCAIAGRFGRMQGGPAMRRSELAKLMTRFPDEVKPA